MHSSSSSLPKSPRVQRAEDELDVTKVVMAVHDPSRQVSILLERVCDQGLSVTWDEDLTSFSADLSLVLVPLSDSRLSFPNLAPNWYRKPYVVVLVVLADVDEYREKHRTALVKTLEEMEGRGIESCVVYGEPSLKKAHKLADRLRQDVKGKEERLVCLTDGFDAIKVCFGSLLSLSALTLCRRW